MKSKKLPWYNITQKMNNETSGSGDEFQFELLHYLTNLVMQTAIKVSYSYA